MVKKSELKPLSIYKGFMMPRLFVKRIIKLQILLFLPLALSGASLDSLVQNAKKSHRSLKVIEQKLSAISDEYELSKNFSNPELSISVSDIQFGDPIDRSLEPMQSSSINFKQKIPYFGKRDALSKKVDAKKESILFSLEDAKVKLAKAIKIKAYEIWQAEEQLRITDEYIALTNQNIELFTAYNNTDASSHMSIMGAELSLSQLQIKKSDLQGLKKGLYKQISYLSAMDVTSIELDSQMTQPKDVKTYMSAYEQNSYYKLKLAKVKEAHADVTIQKLQSYSDPVVQVGYYYRESFEDYVNIGVGFSLPIYGSEDSKQEITRKMELSQRSQANDYKNLLISQIYTLYAKLQNSYEVYTIIHQESLPQIQHMFDLSNSAIKNGAELFLYIDMLERKLSLDEQSIKAQASYHKTLASLDALIGDEK